MTSEKIKYFEQIEKEYLSQEIPPGIFQERVQFCGVNFKVCELLFLRRLSKLMSYDFKEFKQFFMLAHPKTRIMMTYYDVFDPVSNNGFSLSEDWKMRLNILKNMGSSTEKELIDYQGTFLGENGPSSKKFSSWEDIPLPDKDE